ncbi:MAG: preprotein translocase subunit YajC [Paracoccaceae bacterium]|jgi:preprotein translocase subunit YajC
MFVTPAYAQAAGGGAMSSLGQFVPLILIFGIFYLFLIRPQQKRAKEHKVMLAALRRGDEVITQGGIYAKVVRVKEDDQVEVQIAEGVKVFVARSTIAAVVSKTEPAKEA